MKWWNGADFLDSGKYQFSSDYTYEYLYVLTINSTFDKKGIENSQIKLEFKVELRIESCEGVLRVSIFFFKLSIIERIGSWWKLLF